MKSILFALIVCLSAPAFAVAPGQEGYVMHVYYTTCGAPVSTTASGSNIDARRAPQDCWAQIKNGGVLYISLVVNNDLNLGNGVYQPNSVSLDVLHLWNRTYNMFSDFVVDYSAANWASWTESVDGSGVTHGTLVMTNMSTSSPTNICTWTIAGSPIKFTKGAEQFSVWTLDEQDIAFTHNYQSLPC